MFGLLGLFGQSKERQRLDHALRAAGLHPRLVPDAVKIAILKLLKDRGSAGEAPCAHAASLVAYCVLDAEAFGEANPPEHSSAVEARLDAAIEGSDDLDTRLVLLVMHAGLLHPDVRDRFELQVD